VPFTLVGKYAAYQVPLERSVFDDFEATGNQAGIYLKTHAIAGIRCFAERSPEIFTHVFGVAPDQIDSLDELSKPYDALVGMAISSPELFEARYVGRHALIGMTPDAPGVRNPAQTKQKLVATILRALTSSRQ
jgi:hypothetical protein